MQLESMAGCLNRHRSKAVPGWKERYAKDATLAIIEKLP